MNRSILRWSAVQLLPVLIIVYLQDGLLSEGAKILVPGPIVAGMGHVQVLSTLTARLVQSGHDVSLLSGSQTCSDKFAASNASKIIRYQSSVETRLFIAGGAEVKFQDYTIQYQLHKLRIYFDVARNDCRAIVSNTTLLERLKSERFDILIGDALSPCETFLANILGIPWIAVTSSREYFNVCKHVYRVPAEPSYVPQMGLYMFTDKMNFIQRLTNVVSSYVFMYLIYQQANVFSDFIKMKEEFNIAPEMDFWQMSTKAEIWLTQTSNVLDFPAPGLPNVVSVGGLGVRPPNDLTKDLEEFVNGSGEHGFIVFSLGSIIKSLPDAPETRIIAKVLSELPQRILWKHDGPVPLNIGKNVRLLKWLPQNDLLGHPKARLFICHGGLNSVYEGITHAVPMVVIPLMLDEQKENAARVAVKGMGITLDRSKLTEEIFRSAITDVLHNTTYKETVTRYSQILHDRPPLETAVHWIEHVLKFGGAHLRPNVYDMNWFQYNLIDVYGFLLTVIIGMLIFVTYAILFCGGKLCTSRKHSKLD